MLQTVSNPHNTVTLFTTDTQPQVGLMFDLQVWKISHHVEPYCAPVLSNNDAFSFPPQNEYEEISHYCKWRLCKILFATLVLFLDLYRNVGGQWIVFSQVQEPTGEDEYEICDQDDGEYYIY